MSDNNSKKPSEQIDAGLAVPIVLVVLGGPCFLVFLCYLLDRLLLRIGGSSCFFRRTLRACCGIRDGVPPDRPRADGQAISAPPTASSAANASMGAEEFEGVTCCEDVDGVCAVCLESMAGLSSWTLACGHAFHKGCIVGWLAKKRTCPVCRKAQYLNSAPAHAASVAPVTG